MQQTASIVFRRRTQAPSVGVQAGEDGETHGIGTRIHDVDAETRRLAAR
jgi:hypothetical protein